MSEIRSETLPRAATAKSVCFSVLLPSASLQPVAARATYHSSVATWRVGRPCVCHRSRCCPLKETRWHLLDCQVPQPAAHLRLLRLCCFQLPCRVHQRVDLLPQRVREPTAVLQIPVSVVCRRLAHCGRQRAAAPGWDRGPRHKGRFAVVHCIRKPLLYAASRVD